jgi:hypothetical protein
MSQSGYTPIQLYRTTTAAAAPTAGNLAAGELAINLTDEKLYFKNAAGVVKLLASNSGSLGSVTSVDVSGGTTGLTTSGGPITSSGTITLGGTLGVANGGTGATTFTANGVVYGNTTSALLVTAAGTTGQVLVGNTGGAPSWATLTGIGVTSFSGGTTGLTPNTATTGAITLAGTLGVANGGTGATSLSSGYLVKGNGTSAVSASVVYDNGTNVGIGTSSPGAKLDVLVADGAEATKLRGATGRTRIRPYVDATNGSFIDAVNTAENAYIPLSLAGSSIRLTTSAGLAATIDASGNVGIGTPSPATKLHLLTPSATAVALRAGNSVSYAEFQVDASGNSQLVAPGGVQIFNTNGAERMRIDSSGNVGIGTSSPGSALQVNGNIRVSNGTGFATGNSLIRSIQSMSGSSNQFVSNSIDFYTATFTDNGQIAFSTGGVEAMRINGSGNVGIGTSSPTKKLSIETTPSAPTNGFNIQYSGSEVASFTSNAGTGEIRIGATGTGTYFPTFYSNNTERMRIDSSGNLLVGTTAIGAIGTVNGFRARPDGRSLISSATDGVLEVGYNGGNATGTVVSFYKGGALGGSITTDGSTTAYNTSSDVRLKHDIVDAPEASSLIDALQVRSFKWNADNSEQRYGMVAQELAAVAPEAVSQPEDPDAMMGVDYSKLVPMLVKEIQSLRARVAQLEGN